MKSFEKDTKGSITTYFMMLRTTMAAADGISGCQVGNIPKRFDCKIVTRRPSGGFFAHFLLKFKFELVFLFTKIQRYQIYFLELNTR